MWSTVQPNPCQPCEGSSWLNCVKRQTPCSRLHGNGCTDRVECRATKALFLKPSRTFSNQPLSLICDQTMPLCHDQIQRVSLHSDHFDYNVVIPSTSNSSWPSFFPSRSSAMTTLQKYTPLSPHCSSPIRRSASAQRQETRSDVLLEVRRQMTSGQQGRSNWP